METLDEALAALKRDPTRPVRARVDDLTVELRAIPSHSEEHPQACLDADRSAAELFEEIGPWEGETTEEMLAFFENARSTGASRQVAGL